MALTGTNCIQLFTCTTEWHKIEPERRRLIMVFQKMFEMMDDNWEIPMWLMINKLLTVFQFWLLYCSMTLVEAVFASCMALVTIFQIYYSSSHTWTYPNFKTDIFYHFLRFLPSEMWSFPFQITNFSLAFSLETSTRQVIVSFSTQTLLAHCTCLPCPAFSNLLNFSDNAWPSLPFQYLQFCKLFQSRHFSWSRSCRGFRSSRFHHYCRSSALGVPSTLVAFVPLPATVASSALVFLLTIVAQPAHIALLPRIAPPALVVLLALEVLLALVAFLAPFGLLRPCTVLALPLQSSLCLHSPRFASAVCLLCAQRTLIFCCLPHNCTTLAHSLHSASYPCFLLSASKFCPVSTLSTPCIFLYYFCLTPPFFGHWWLKKSFIVAVQVLL